MYGSSFTTAKEFKVHMLRQKLAMEVCKAPTN